MPNLPSSRGINQCQRDEYPPAVMDNSGFQWLRFIPASDNTGAGSLFRGVCPPAAPVESTTIFGRIPDQNYVCTDTVFTTVTIDCMSMAFANLPQADYGIDDNECQPELVTHDPGFALMVNDIWYWGKPYNPGAYSLPIPSSILAQVHAYPAPGVAGMNNNDGPIPQKRKRHVHHRLHPHEAPSVRYVVVPADMDAAAFQAEDDFPTDLDPDTLAVKDPLTGEERKATDEELWDMFGLLRCQSDDCEYERALLDLADDDDAAASRTSPRHAPVASPTAADAYYSAPTAAGRGTSHEVIRDGLPRATAAPTGR